MNRFVVGALSAAVLLCSAGDVRAQVTPPQPVVFAAVDGVRYNGSNMYVTGIVQGETIAREVGFPFTGSYLQYRETCERLALVAIAKPGQYLFTMQRDGWGSIAHCALSRVAP